MDPAPLPSLTIVVPVFGNAATLGELLERLRRACADLPAPGPEIVFVDDGSPDDSFLVLSAMAAADKRVVVIQLSRNFGSNAAVLAGVSHARGPAVCVIAADLQDPPELIPELVARWREGAQVVMAARRKRDDPFLMRLPSAVFNRLFRRFVFRDFPAGGFDFVLLDRQVVDSLRRMPETHSYFYGQVFWLGFRRAVVPYDRARRPSGRSAWTFARRVKYFIDAFTAFSYLPVRAASFAGLVLAGLGFAYAAVVLWQRLAGNIPERGFSALMVVLLVVSGTQLLVTGIMGEYLWRALEEIRARPPFVVARSINLPDP